MSFASYCKDEATQIKIEQAHCKMAILEPLLRLSSDVIRRGGDFVVSFSTQNAHIAGLFMRLVKELYHAEVNLISKESTKFEKKSNYVVEVITQAENIIEEFGLFHLEGPNHDEYDQRECCSIAYLRGAFICRGSVSDPHKSDYHLEISTSQEHEAIFIQHLMNKFDLNAKLSRRRNDLVIYIKEIGKIIDFLRIIGISNMVFKLEEIQIQREFKNNLNRKVNSEIANSIKTLDAAKQQLAHIRYIEYNYPLEKLDSRILLIMKVRKENPDASFKELLVILNEQYGEKITKSGLNHRFIKIKELAEEIKESNKK